MYSDSPNKNQSNFVFALAYELKQYLETNADELDPDTYDNINYWRGGILSQGKISDEDLSEIIEYIGAEKLQELIELASSKTASFNN
ncbi:conserved hypothetical protein [Hyella patelloides LEGE 07179]|uniref:Uncharacterized protein n=1 Tax=Hyella patelloides LEGE 07179 TaxID=945734 RepID=A0A563VX42_9CYAN|nr:hypothetical protein [Hyella patelloides]VEP15986.1 conserved hypothetical protein [Hyella patelloides LEGE 07179]